MRRSSAADRLVSAAGIWITATAFLLPLKFGGLAAMPEAAANYPAALWEYLLISWPPSFIAVAGPLALLPLAAAGVVRKLRADGACAAAMLWCAGLFAATLPGWLRTANLEAAFIQSLHYAGCGCFGLAAALLIRADAVWKSRLINALSAGTMLLGVAAFHQYLFGFSDTRRFIEEAVAAGAAAPDKPLQLFLADDRVYATFSSCNTLAGFLLLVLPTVVLALLHWGNRFEPTRIARPLFAGIALLLTAGPLLLTQSRGAFLAALLTAGVWFFAQPAIRRRWKLIVLAALLLVIAAAAWRIGARGRGFGSMAERIDYLRTAAVLVAERPLDGTGWESFHLRHMKIKTTRSDEAARDPHNPVASFAAQCGIPAGILAAAALLTPLVLLGRRSRRPETRDALGEAVLWGFFAFALHCCMEINFLVPANLAGAAMLLAAALTPDDDHGGTAAPTAGRHVFDAVFTVCAALVAAATLVAALRWIPGEIAFARFSDAVHPLPGAIATDPQTAEREALARRGRSYAVWELVGERRLGYGDPAGAETAFFNAQKWGGERASLQWKLAAAAEMMNRPEEAARYRRRARELFPTNPIYRRPSASGGQR